jgi:ribose transport system substrate-binding protein
VHTNSSRSPRPSLKKTGRWALAALVTALAAIALAACGSSSDESSSSSASGDESASSEPTKVAFLVGTLEAGFPKGVLGFMEEAAARENVEITTYNARFDPAKQVSQCQDAVTKGYDAIIAFPAASPPMVACAAQAESAGIPLIVTNTPIGSDYTSFTTDVPGVDSQVLIPANTSWGPEGAGVLLENMCATVEGDCNIGLIEGVPTSALTTAAAEGVEAAVEKNGWNLSGTCVGNFLQSGGLSCAQNMLQKDPEINVIISQSDAMALGAELALKDLDLTAGQDVLIGTQGSSIEGVEKIKQGTWFGTIITDAQGDGEIPVELAVEAAAGKTVPKSVNPHEKNELPLVFDQENKEEYPSFKGGAHI